MRNMTLRMAFVPCSSQRQVATDMEASGPVSWFTQQKLDSSSIPCPKELQQITSNCSRNTLIHPVVETETGGSLGPLLQLPELRSLACHLVQLNQSAPGPSKRPYLKTQGRTWRDGSTVKSTSCSSRGPRFDFQHPDGGSQLSVTPVQRTQCPSSVHSFITLSQLKQFGTDLFRNLCHCTQLLHECGVETECSQNTHTRIVKVKVKNKQDRQNLESDAQG